MINISSTDGHTGIENQKVAEGGSGHFRLILSALNSPGRTIFVIHAYSSLVSEAPLRYLEQIGFSHFNDCQFHSSRCFYRSIAEVQKGPVGFENYPQIQGIHTSFRIFADKIGELYSQYESQNNILRGIGLQAPAPTIFATPPMIEIEPSDVPLWVEEVEFKRLRELKSHVKQMNEEIEDLTGYLPLVFASGDTLENAVVKALRYFGLEAECAEKGYTADVLAHTKDSTKKFGVEVTGINGAIKKSSRKLTQVLDFERIKENNEKTILMANTYSEIPVSERHGKEDFTQQVIDFLAGHSILLMTGCDLYEMVRDVMENEKNPEAIIELLYNSDGVLKY